MFTGMSERPSTRWRREAAEQTAAVAAGTMTADEAYAPRLWPDDFTAAVDRALGAYEQEVARLDASDDDAVWAAVERVVTRLNEIDDDEGRIETGEREDLAGHIEVVLTGAGIDVEALTGRRGLKPHEITDTWRDW